MQLKDGGKEKETVSSKPIRWNELTKSAIVSRNKKSIVTEEQAYNKHSKDDTAKIKYKRFL